MNSSLGQIDQNRNVIVPDHSQVQWPADDAQAEQRPDLLELLHPSQCDDRTSARQRISPPRPSSLQQGKKKIRERPEDHADAGIQQERALSRRTRPQNEQTDDRHRKPEGDGPDGGDRRQQERGDRGADHNGRPAVRPLAGRRGGDAAGPHHAFIIAAMPSVVQPTDPNLPGLPERGLAA
jgi:hypothetical protein